MVKLSLRLSAIADLVPEGAKVCDVGTDHGFLPIFLKDSGRAKSVIATDINVKPLKKAEENVRKSGAADIQLRLCDGVEGVRKDEADTVIIAGIGGEVISGIIERGSEILKFRDITLILQPTTSPEALRRHLTDNGFSILREIPIEENGKLYSVMKCAYEGESRSYPAWYYYSGLVDPKEPVGKKYIEKQKNRAFKCMKALENIEAKQADYNFYKEIYEGLWRLTADS